MITNKEILFASLVGGSNYVETLSRTLVSQNELQKHVLLKIPYLPFNSEQKIQQKNVEELFVVNEVSAAVDEASQYFPLSFSLTANGPKFVFPYEPMINIGSGNNIIKRNIAKQGNSLIGTIKERWSRKDFEITVNGFLLGSIQSGKVEDCYPKEQLIRLFEFLKHNKEFFIYSEPLEILGINKVVVEDYSFPFSKGENVQAYELKLVSDFDYQLLIEENLYINA